MCVFIATVEWDLKSFDTTCYYEKKNNGTVNEYMMNDGIFDDLSQETVDKKKKKN
jgi:hypothetical protein